MSIYSQYQFFLYKTIVEHREKGKTFDQIAEWLNRKGYLSIRGKKFRSAHVHSIVKKKRLKDEKLEREYPEEWSEFSLEVVDKTILMRDFYKIGNIIAVKKVYYINTIYPLF